MLNYCSNTSLHSWKIQEYLVSPSNICGFFPAGFAKLVFHGRDIDKLICFYVTILPEGL